MKLLAIDGNSILNRAYHAIKLLSNKNGVYTNAVFGFMNIYLKNVNKVKPDAIAVAFDLHEPTFRHKAIVSYKANRHGHDEELLQQFPIIKSLLGYMGIKILECSGFEADDILGTLAEICSKSQNQCFILTGDRDSLQLIDKNVTVLLATNSDTVFYDNQKFTEEYGFEPLSLIDYKALMGDSSDNISGVAGIGKKTASDLIKEYGTIEKLYSEYQDSELKQNIKKKLAEGYESAKESKWLATIVKNVPLENDINVYIPQKPDNQQLSRLLTELEMYKILEKLNLPIWDSNKITEEDFQPIEISVSELDETVISGLESASYVFDGVKIAVRKENNIYTSQNSEVIKKFLQSECVKITTDSKPHYRYAFENGITLKNLKSDIQICGYLLNVTSKDYSTEKLCAEYGIHYYSENDTYAELVTLENLESKLCAEIEKNGMKFLFEEVEMPLIEVLASMEHYGISIDKKGVEDFGIYLTEKIEETQKIIFDDVGHEFNISSPKQLGTVLFEELGLPAEKKTKTGYSTNAEILENLRSVSPVVENVLKYRQYTKLKSTYVTGLIEKISGDGRIHSCFNQTETRTGRISSTEPNMQNIPVRTELGSQMRKFFTAEKNRILVDADYSQIELRVMAHLCGDKNLIEAFNSGEDIHTSTASQVFDVPPIMVTHDMRSTAKAVNFGIIYGIGAFSLSKDINVTVGEAQKYIDDYMKKYPKVKEFTENTVSGAVKNGYVTTMFGRKRMIPEIKSSNKVVQSAGKRIAMNTPVQGTSADLIKMAMINVYRRLKAENLNAQLILQVHDELIIESDIECSERCAVILKEEMQNVYNMKVQLLVDVNKGASWYDAKG